MKELLAEIVAAVIAAGILGLVTLAWSFLRRFPWLLVALGGGLMVFAASLAVSFGTTNFQTDGSPAGTILFVVLASVVVLAALAGVFLVGKGVLGSGSSGPFMALLGVAAMAAVLSFAYRVHRGPDAGESFRPGKHRIFPPTSELASQRVAPLAETYALAWKARGDANALQLSVPGAQLVPDPRARGPGVVETVDGPRTVDLLLQGGATMRLHRDDSTVDEATFAALQGKSTRDATMPRSLWTAMDRKGWRLLGIDCPKGAAEAAPALAATVGHAATCHAPPGPLARWLPSLFGPARAPLAVRTEPRSCQWAFPYRDRVVTVTREGPCFTTEGLAALGAAAGLLERMERGIGSGSR